MWHTRTTAGIRTTTVLAKTLAQYQKKDLTVFVGKMKERTLHLADCKCLLERGTLMIDAVLIRSC